MIAHYVVLQGRGSLDQEAESDPRGPAPELAGLGSGGWGVRRPPRPAPPPPTSHGAARRRRRSSLTLIFDGWATNRSQGERMLLAPGADGRQGQPALPKGRRAPAASSAEASRSSPKQRVGPKATWAVISNAWSWGTTRSAGRASRVHRLRQAATVTLLLHTDDDRLDRIRRQKRPASYRFIAVATRRHLREDRRSRAEVEATRRPPGAPQRQTLARRRARDNTRVKLRAGANLHEWQEGARLMADLNFRLESALGVGSAIARALTPAVRSRLSLRSLQAGRHRRQESRRQRRRLRHRRRRRS